MTQENKSYRRISVLQKILQNSVQSKHVNASINRKIQIQDLQVEITDPSSELQQAFDVLFTQEALTFLSELHFEFDQQIDQMYWNRLQNKIRYSANFNKPKFLNTPERRDKQWNIHPLPPRLLCRNIDLGDVSPANTKHLVDALTSDVQGIQVDFDDGHCPTWRNQIIGLYNVYKVVHGLFENLEDLNKLPILMLRPRAWNMIEHNIMINGKKLPGSLVDFAILMFHNAQKLSINKNGPFLYLSKLEGAKEAKLWNDIFIWTQMHLNIPRGTIKACVLIENILSSFEMDEILFELREHSMGLNCGIWDYAASIISKFGNNPNFLLPDRNKYVNMDKHFLKKYMELVIQTCHMRGAPATGGMAAQLVSVQNDNQTVQKVIQAKIKEIVAGCDGFLIYDTKIIPFIKTLWDNRLNLLKNNQKQIKITETDLLIMPTGSVTIEGMKHNIQVAILFIYHWFNGEGHFYLKNSVEDSATAEISRSQIWQWIKHQAILEDSGEIVTKTMIENMSADFVKECINKNQNILVISREIFLDIVTARYFVEFITSYLNDSFVFRRLQHKCIE